MMIGLWRDCRGRENARNGAPRRCLLVAVTFWWAGHWGFCMRKRQQGQRSAKGPASGRLTGVRASTLMATRKGRLVSWDPRKWKPFLAFRRETVARWQSPPRQQRSLRQAFPAGERSDGQKGKREVNKTPPRNRGRNRREEGPHHEQVRVCR